jgi:hypothetical protein
MNYIGVTMINFEVKKDGMRQMQDGIWKLSLTVLPEDMPMELLQAPMGTPYGLAMVPIDYDNPEPVTSIDIGIPTDPDTGITVSEKSEGDKIRVRAVMLCKDAEFQKYLFGNVNPSHPGTNETAAKIHITTQCDISSRSELTENKEAQAKFRELDSQFTEWRQQQDFDNQHGGNNV